MEAKEKARELVEKFMQPIDELHKYPMCKSTAKQCALIAVEEICEAIDFDWMEVQNLDRQHQYWQQVKTEIKNI